jgi:hypothetical protein
MNHEGIIGCLNQVSTMLDQRGLSAGSLMHSIQQLITHYQGELAGKAGVLEQKMTIMITHQSAEIQKQAGDVVKLTRIIDNVAIGTKDIIDTEQKTYARISDALRESRKEGQLLADAIKNISGRETMTKFSQADFAQNMEAAQTAIRRNLDTLRKDMLDMGFSESTIQMAMRGFNWVDKFGNVLKTQINEKGEIIFDPAMAVVSEKLGQAATKEVSGSPDFSPAMKIVLGPSGKMSEAATAAAQGTNLTAAGEVLEKKIETSVGGAINEAGNKISLASAKELAGKIGAGVTSLSNIMTSIPQLYNQVNDLADAWEKPNKSTKDYMDLVGQMGGVLNQGVQTIQALSGVLQIASAAQAVFNAIAALNPYVLIALAIIAVIAGIALLIIYWDKVKAALRDNPWLAVAASLFGIIGIIVVIIAYWDEIKLAALKAANFVSIQIQKIGHFFVGLKNLAGMVWDWIVAQVENAGIGIVNVFITVGVKIENFFIDLINGVLSLYNKLADSVIGDVLGLSKADLIPPVQLESKLIPPKEVPKIDVEAAFKTDEIKGGLEDQIAKQQKVVDEANKKDEERRQKEREEKAKAAAAPPPPAPGALAPPALAVSPGAAPQIGVPGAADLGRPALPRGAVPAAAGPTDSSLHIGVITINLNAEKLEADSSKLLTDELVRQLEAKLEVLARQRDFRTGTRAAAA